MLTVTLKYDSFFPKDAPPIVFVHDGNGKEVASVCFDQTATGVNVEVYRDEDTQVAVVPVKT